MADGNRDDRDTNYFRESYGSQDANRYRGNDRKDERSDDRGQYGYGQQGTRSSGYGDDSDTRRGYSGYEGRDYNDRYSDRGTQGAGQSRYGADDRPGGGDAFGGRAYGGSSAGGAYSGGSYAGRDYGYGDSGRTVQGSGAQGRNFAERAGDEVRSWAGDQDAERRREQDARQIGRYPGEQPGARQSSGGYGSSSGYGASGYGRGDYGSTGYSQNEGYGGRTSPTVTYSDDNERGGKNRADGGYGARSSSSSAYDNRGSGRTTGTEVHPDDRGFFAKAGDEVKSWFGDDEADRRRQSDAARDDATQAFSGNTSTAGYGYTGGTAAYAPTSNSTAGATSNMPHDPHYASYRQARMDEYDRDYHEYRQSKQKDFHDDFHAFRTNKSSTGSTGSSTAIGGAIASVGAALGMNSASGSTTNTGGATSMGSSSSMTGTSSGITGSASGMSGSATGIAAQLKEHMVVDGSDGQGVGKIDHVMGSDIKLTKHDSTDNKHHLIPISWVASVEGGKVKLNKTSEQAMREWRVADETTKTQA